MDYCINCAAYTAVDKAETNEVMARAINITSVEFLAKACSNHNAKLIHFSTDYVYHSEKTNLPYSEGQKTDPKGIYAVTKLLGEQVARAKCNQTIIIRTSWIYSSFGNNFVKTIEALEPLGSKTLCLTNFCNATERARKFEKPRLHVQPSHADRRLLQESLGNVPQPRRKFPNK